MKKRSTNVQRNTLETQITVQINLDGTGKSHFETGVPFLEHMLDQVARHGIIDLEIIAKGDLPQCNAYIFYSMMGINV